MSCFLFNLLLMHKKNVMQGNKYSSEELRTRSEFRLRFTKIQHKDTKA